MPSDYERNFYISALACRLIRLVVPMALSVYPTGVFESINARLFVAAFRVVEPAEELILLPLSRAFHSVACIFSTLTPSLRKSLMMFSISYPFFPEVDDSLNCPTAYASCLSLFAPALRSAD